MGYVRIDDYGGDWSHIARGADTEVRVMYGRGSRGEDEVRQRMRIEYDTLKILDSVI